ncbi:MAG: fatty acid desaturase [Deltaproteobacteria bacterium]|nr:fatty acid desaturase [Deltaproteobacteria bacterium]
MQRIAQGLKWPNVAFFLLSPLVAVVGTILVMRHGGGHWATWVLAGGMLYASGLAITAGYHRLFSHRTYQAVWLVRLLLLLFGSAALEGSVRWWCMEHRDHHGKVDTEEDPYGINKGFWFAHIGWLLIKEHDAKVGYGNIKDLERDPLVRLQDRFYAWFALVMGFALPTGLAALWGDALGGLFIAGLGRIVLNHHLTFCINSFCHYVGRQTYSDRHSARDSWIAALLTWGEGYHNFHHEFEIDYRNGIRAYHWDPAKWLIYCLERVGLAWNLRRVSRQKILAAKLQMDQKRIAARLARQAHPAMERIGELVAAARERLQHSHDRLMTLKQEYRALRRQKTTQLVERLGTLRRDLQQTRREFKLAMAQWRILLRGPLPVSG